MKFWLVVRLAVAVVLAAARVRDRPTGRLHSAGLRGSVRSRDEGLGDVIGKDFAGLDDHRPIDPTGGSTS